MTNAGAATGLCRNEIYRTKCAPVVALPGVGHMPGPGDDEQEAARVFYVAATRTTQRLMIGVGGDEGFGRKLGT